MNTGDSLRHAPRRRIAGRARLHAKVNVVVASVLPGPVDEQSLMAVLSPSSRRTLGDSFFAAAPSVERRTQLNAGYAIEITARAP